MKEFMNIKVTMLLLIELIGMTLSYQLDQERNREVKNNGINKNHARLFTWSNLVL